jgi:hypothetical protein
MYIFMLRKIPVNSSIIRTFEYSINGANRL